MLPSASALLPAKSHKGPPGAHVGAACAVPVFPVPVPTLKANAPAAIAALKMAPLVSRLAPMPAGAACLGCLARSAGGTVVFEESIALDLPLRRCAIVRCDAGPISLPKSVAEIEYC
jgi:hypothetical protein